MAGPKDIQNRPLPSQFQQRPTTSTPPQTGKAKTAAGQAQDAARVVQGAGFVRPGASKRKSADASDPLSGQLVLPDSELDLDAQSLESLKSSLARTEEMAGKLMGIEQAPGESSPSAFCEALLTFSPEKELYLREIAERATEPLPDALEDALKEALLSLGERASPGATTAELLVQLSAKVAGLPAEASSDVITAARSLCKKANQSVGQAQKMIQGIDQQLSVHRTFVFRR